jgi:Leu/Phe-tRNA-protein transferase
MNTSTNNNICIKTCKIYSFGNLKWTHQRRVPLILVSIEIPVYIRKNNFHYPTDITKFFSHNLYTLYIW